ncbi:MAG: squalene--hopene cyclase, partial [Gemmataceae bacterium]
MDRQLNEALDQVLADLMAARDSRGHWEGELCSSALSTAVAVSAMAHAGQAGGETGSADWNLVLAGLDWLAANQNDDGGFGDTIRSKSNLSTSILCLCAWRLTRTSANNPEPYRRCEEWVRRRAGTTPGEWARAVRDFYGTDRTFSVPILTTCALAGLVGWDEVPRLPHELSVLPQSWYRFASMPVVSYALPALISMGICIHRNRPTLNPWSGVRSLAAGPALRVLTQLQPENGGFLEATPLTAFVALSLAGAGERAHPVVGKALGFLRASARA